LNREKCQQKETEIKKIIQKKKRITKKKEMTKLLSNARVLKVKILLDFLYCLAEKSASRKNV
jgi:hypothetical protein